MSTVRVDLDGPDFWALTRIAENRGLTVVEVVTAAMRDVLGIPAKDRRSRIVALVRAGVDDGTISANLGETRQYVAEVRRAAGLPPNKRKAGQ